MFSQACIKNSVLGEGGGKGGCPPLHPGGVYASGFGGGGVHPSRQTPPTPLPPGRHPPEKKPPSPQTVTAADGTHPTVMHSCLEIRS